MERYNLIVLGAGSGGLTVAGGAALLGARVALLEKHRMGGDCLNYGCVGSWSCDVDTVPWTTFTDPAVARVGLSEAQTRERGVRYDVFTTPFDDNDRALCDGEPEGFVKVLTRKGSATILGATIVHAQAGELLAELVLAQKHRLGLSKLSSPIHVYPTLGEANRTLVDAYLLGRLTPTMKRVLARVFAWLRRG